MRLLQKHRPERPIDGVIVTIPCTDLLGGDDQNELDPNRLTEKANLIYDKLWNAQKLTGIRFPVYIVISKCDQIDGFQSFCREIPERLGKGIFGWSNPYAVNTGYSSEWGAEAFQHIKRNLIRNQFEIYTARTDLRENEEIFLFPENFMSLAEPLQIYLDQLFKQSVYHESFIFRGLYFCGDSGIDQSGKVSNKTFFLADLLEKKIFPESGLAIPIAKTLISRNRSVLAAQITAGLILLIGGLGLWRAHALLSTAEKYELPALTEIGRDVHALEARPELKYKGMTLYDYLGKKTIHTSFEADAKNLVIGMVNIREMKSIFIPSSWFSEIHQEIGEAIVFAYEEIVLRTMYIELVRRTKTILEGYRSGSSRRVDVTELQPLETYPEFIELRSFVKRLVELEEHANLYNGLRDPHNIGDTAPVVKYLFNMDMFQDVEKYAKYFTKYFRQGKHRTRFYTYDPTIFQIKAEYILVLIQNLYDRLFKYNVICAGLQNFGFKLDQFKQVSPGSTYYVKLMRDLLDEIGQLEIKFTHPASAWMVSETFNLGESFAGILTSVKQSRFFGPDILPFARQEGQDALIRLKHELKQKKSKLTGPILLQEAGQARLEFSPPVLELKAGAGTLLGYEFIETEPSKAPKIEIPPGTRLTWDTALLNEEPALLQPYNEFIKGDLKKFPKDLRQTVKRMAKNSLENSIYDIIVKAQHLEPITNRFTDDSLEIAVRAEINNFTEAAKILNRLIIAFYKLGLAESHMVLSRLLEWQTSTLMETVDGFLTGEDLYSIRGDDLSWWDGKTKLSYTAFDVVDQKELNNYLNLQRERINHLAYDYAEPIVTFLLTSQIPRGPTDEKIFFKWERILSQLDQYRNKKPGNSLSALEKFIRFEMNEINEDNYFEKISAKDLQTRSGDYFLSRRNKLRRMLYEKSRQLAEQKKYMDYQKIGDFFNQQLAGKFPFAAIGKEKVYAEAVPADIGNFSILFDKEAPALKETLKRDQRYGVSGRHVLKFLDQMTQLRPIFASYIEIEDKESKELPTLDFDVEFRVNRKREQLANRIIGWKLTVADQVFTRGADKLAGRWRYGDPIKLALRWAKDAKDYPVFGGDQAGIKIEGKSIQFAFANQWSLLRLLRLHAGTAEDFDQHMDPKPHTLKFVIDTRREVDKKEAKAKAKAKTKKEAKAKIYLRLVLVVTDKTKKIQKVIEIPAFPEKAPHLNKIS